MLRRFSIPIAKVKVGNIYESLLNEICQKNISFYLANEITKLKHTAI